MLNTGEVDASAYACQPLDFDVVLGWPGLAKFLVAVPLLILVLVVVAVWFLIARRLKLRGQRRQANLAHQVMRQIRDRLSPSLHA